MIESRDGGRRFVDRCGFVFGLVLLAAYAGVTAAAENAVVSATAGGDRLTLQLEAGSPSRLEVRIDSVVVFSEATVDLSSITINGLGGDDTLTVDYSNGFFATPTTFNGGGQETLAGDSLVITGSVPGGFDTTYGAGPPSLEGKTGTVTSRGANSSHIVVFTGLEPITVVGVGGSLTVNGPAGTGVLTLADDAADTAGPGGNFFTGDNGIETLYFAGFSTFTAYGGVGSQTLTVESIDPAPSAGGHALTSITVDGGDSAGTDSSGDTINLRSLPSTVSAALRGGAGNDTINLGSTAEQLDGILGQVTADGGPYRPGGNYLASVTANGLTISMNLPIGDSLHLDDDGTTAAAQYNMDATTFNRDSTVASLTYSNFQYFSLRAGHGNNDVNILDTAPMLIPIHCWEGVDDIDVTTTATASQLLIQPADGVDSVTIADMRDGSMASVFGGDHVEVVTTGVGCGLRINGSDFTNDDVTVRDLGAGSALLSSVYRGADRISVERSAATSEIELHGDEGDDVFAVGDPGLDNLLGGFSADGGAGTDSLTFDDSTDSSNNSYDVLAASLVRTGSPSLAFGAVETLSLLCGSGQDDVVVDLDNPPSAVQTFVLDTGDETGSVGDSVTAYGTAAIDMQLWGGDPADAPGDSLVYTAPLAFFTEFETLESSALVVSPEFVDFGFVPPGSPIVCQTIEITNNGSISYDWSATGCDAGPFSLSPTTPGGSIAAGGSQSFDVCLDPTSVADPAIATCTIDFSSNDPNLSTMDIPVSANLGVAIPLLGTFGILLLALLISGGALHALRR